MPQLLSADILKVLLLGLLAMATAMQAAMAQTRDLGNGFRDHGPFSRATESRGTVCTVDGDGKDVVLVWLFDHRYAYALAVIDARTGEVEEIPRPIPSDCPFASILSSKGRYYTHMGGHFLEFDPLKREFTFVQEGPERAAMSMTEDDEGVIWAAIAYNSDVVSYNPETGEFRNYGPVYEHPSRQYPRHMAADDQGWVYIGIGVAVQQIVMLNPETGQVTAAIPEEKVGRRGGARVHRDLNGKVYGVVLVDVDNGDPQRFWFELHGGQATMLDEEPSINHKPIITGSQGLRHYDLPSGERVRELDLIEGRLVVENPDTGGTRELQFSIIAGEGGASMGLAAAPDGTIAGGTYIPSWFFNYNPRTDEWVRHDCYGQWNVVTAAGDRFYTASYGTGELLEWDPVKEWVPTERRNPDSNPRLVTSDMRPHVSRTYTILAHPDGRHIIYGGTPGYGSTGGGLVFYDTETETAELIKHEDLIPWHTQASLVALPDGRIVGGTSKEPGSGGTPRAEVAELYILNMETRQIEWHDALIEGAGRYNDMIVGPDGKVFGIVDRTRLFVFDPAERAIVHQHGLEPEFGQAVHQQGPRIFIQVPDGRIFVLFVRGIAQLNPETYEVTMVAEAPRNLGNGGAYLDGRLYFAAGVSLFSWEVPAVD